MQCGSHCAVCNTTASSPPSSVVSHPFCVCEAPFANVGDLAPNAESDCFIHFEWSKGLHSFGAAVWLLAFALSAVALIRVRRSVYTLLIKERFTTAWLTVTCIFCSSWHLLEARAEYPGQYSLGMNIVSTLLWQISMFFVFAFVFSLPLIKSGTSVLPFAVQQTTPRLRRYFSSFLFIVFLFSQGVNALVWAVYVNNDSAPSILIAFFALTALWGTVMSACFFYVTTMMMRKMTKILKSPELVTSQRSKIVMTYQSAQRTRFLTLLAAGISLPVYLAFAASTVLARFTYIFFPVGSALFGAIVAWHSTNSLTISTFVAGTTTSGAARSRVEGQRSEDADTLERPSSNDDNDEPKMRTLGRRPRKKKAGGRKLMSKVTEENSVADDSQLQTGGMISGNSNEYFGSSLVQQPIKEESRL